MARDLDPLKEISWRKDGPIAPVDPTDLKRVWEMQEKFKEENPEPRYRC
jgi:hypothetical protein